jgi:hypothetical protein
MADVMVAKASPSAGGKYQPHPEGQYALRCVDVIDLGLRVEQFQDNPAKVQPKVALVFRSGELNDEGAYIEITKELTVSMHERAGLRKFLGQWRGKSYTEEEAIAGAPLHKLEGVYALASVEQRVSAGGNTYANIATIAPLPKAMPKPDVGDYERPEYWATRKAEYAEGVAKFKGAGTPRPFSETPAALEDDSDDLPF